MDAKYFGSGPPTEELEDFLRREAKQRTFVEGLKESEYLYDIGRDQETEFDPKAHRDRFYSQTLEKKMSRHRRTGPYTTVSSTYGQFDGMSPGRPEHGCVNSTKTFYDKGHL